jgi:hypothetical protein
VRIGSDSDWRRIAVGGNASCGIKDSGELWCWGGTYNGHGGWATLYAARRAFSELPFRQL